MGTIIANESECAVALNSQLSSATSRCKTERLVWKSEHSQTSISIPIRWVCTTSLPSLPFAQPSSGAFPKAHTTFLPNNLLAVPAPRDCFRKPSRSILQRAQLVVLGPSCNVLFVISLEPLAQANCPEFDATVDESLGTRGTCDEGRRRVRCCVV